jgi:hypothetical protein
MIQTNSVIAKMERLGGSDEILNDRYNDKSYGSGLG